MVLTSAHLRPSVRVDWFTLRRVLELVTPAQLLVIQLLLCIIPELVDKYSYLDQQLDRLSPVDDGAHYDFIIVGAGSAGAVVANRLANSPAKFKVLVLEAGGDQNFITYIPGFDILSTGYSRFDYNYESTPQVNSCKACDKNKFAYPRGKGLGGSSAINFMMYLRGSPKDFDHWANVTGDDGWNSTEVLKYYQTHEHYTGKFPGPSHGCGGELNIDKLRFNHESAPRFHEAVREREPFGKMRWADVNSFENQTDSYMHIESTTSGGVRWSTNTAFLSTLPRDDRVKIQKYSHTTKLLFAHDDPTKVTGVEYLWHPDEEVLQAGTVSLTQATRVYRAYADREVILSAGALNSPLILMHSGIGPQDHLEENGIPVRKNLPVGNNLQDHVTVPTFILLKKKFSSFVAERDIIWDTIGSLQKLNPIGWLGATSILGTGFWSSPINDDKDHADIQHVITYYGMTDLFKDVIRPFIQFSEEEYKELINITEKEGTKDGHLTLTVLARPRSAGTVRLNSTFKDGDKLGRYMLEPMIDPNYYADEHDVNTTILGVQNVLDFYKNNTQYKDIFKFAGGLKSCRNISDDYTSREFLDCYIRHYTMNLWHFSGTCKMGKDDDPTAVVDSKLRVRGIKNLRVVDASIMPNVTNGNTNAPTIMIGEKGARMILEAHGRKFYPERIGKRRECRPNELPKKLPSSDDYRGPEIPVLFDLLKRAVLRVMKFDLGNPVLEVGGKEGRKYMDRRRRELTTCLTSSLLTGADTISRLPNLNETLGAVIKL